MLIRAQSFNKVRWLASLQGKPEDPGSIPGGGSIIVSKISNFL